jgi:hypothetical protein
VERLQQKKMRIRGDIEDTSSVRRPMDPLALQQLQDRYTQQQLELLQCRYPYHPQHILRFYQLFQFACSRDITKILHSFRRTLCELKQQRLEAEKQLTQKKLQLKQQEA